MTDNTPINTVVRLPSGQFAPGTSGRPIGSKNRISSEAMQAVKGMSNNAISQLKQRLDAGDWQAIIFILERILPKGRLIELDGISPDQIVSQMLTGSITTVEAKDIAAALESLNEINDMKEVRDKLAFLERILTGGK